MTARELTESRCQHGLVLLGTFKRTTKYRPSLMGGTSPAIWSCQNLQFHEIWARVAAETDPGETALRRILSATNSSAHRSDKNWKIVFASGTIAAILAAVGAGLAISAVEESVIPIGARRLGPADSLPELPSVDIALYKSPEGLRGPAAGLGQSLRRCLTRDTAESLNNRSNAIPHHAPEGEIIASPGKYPAEPPILPSARTGGRYLAANQTGARTLGV
jgi:hypothetical protein